MLAVQAENLQRPDVQWCVRVPVNALGRLSQVAPRLLLCLCRLTSSMCVNSLGMVRRESWLRGTVPGMLVEAPGNPSCAETPAPSVRCARYRVSQHRYARRPTLTLQPQGKDQPFPGQREWWILLCQTTVSKSSRYVTLGTCVSKAQGVRYIGHGPFDTL